MDEGKGSKSIEIPAGLFKKLQLRINGSEFSSVSEYAVFVLSKVLALEEKQQDAESEDVKERLRSLGYLD